MLPGMRGEFKYCRENVFPFFCLSCLFSLFPFEVAKEKCLVREREGKEDVVYCIRPISDEDVDSALWQRL